jgi:preprotein translocase subunit YajC
MGSDSALTCRPAAMTYTLFAQDEAPPQPPPGIGGPMFPFFLIGLMLLFYVVVILPMGRRQKKEQEKMLASLKAGMKVLTSGGIVGTVVTAKDGDDEIVIRSEDTRLRIKRSVVIQVLDGGESK